MKDPRTRVVLTAVFILAVAAARPVPWYRFIVMAALLVFAGVCWKVPLRTAALRLIPTLGLVLGAALGILFGAPPEQALTVAMRLVLMSAAAVITVLSMRVTEMLGALRSLGVPPTIVSMLLLTSRYVHLSGEEVLRVSRAWQCRAGGRFRVRHAVSLGHAAAALTTRAFLRSERLAWAMVSRGFNGQLPCRPLPPLLGVEALSTVVAAGLILLIAVA